MIIYCCECKEKINANKVTGEVIYPHRKDLYSLVFYQCPTCKNYVGTHKNSKDNTPLGNIPAPEIREKRKEIHAILDPIWKNKKIKRKELYKIISKKLGFQYHTATTRTINECEKVINLLNELKLKESKQ